MSSKLNDIMRSIGEWALESGGTTAEEHVKKLDRQIAAAGGLGDLRGIQLLGQEVVSLVLFPSLWLFIFWYLPFMHFMFEGPKQFLFYLLFIWIGFIFPTFRIRDMIKRRQEAISLSLPDMVDLLTISVEAGLDFMTSLKRVVDKQRPGPLRNELERFFRQMELGRTRRDALREMSNRVQLDDLSNMCSALIQADRLGSSIGPVLRIQSDVLRTRRMQRAEKRAMEAPVKMMAPLLACIFPAVFIVMFAPLFIQMIRDLTN